MWKEHVVDLGKLFKIGRVVKKLIQNLTRCEKVDSKSDNMKKFYSKSRFLQKLLHSKSCFLEKIFSLKSCFLILIFPSKSCFLNMHVNRKICAFYGVK